MNKRWHVAEVFNNVTELILIEEFDSYEEAVIACRKCCDTRQALIEFGLSGELIPDYKVVARLV